MDLFHLMTDGFWAVCLVFGGVNHVVAERRLRASARLSEEQKTLARSYLRRFWAASSVPWLVMGWGVLVGQVPGVWSYFRPQDGNPYVLAWFATIFLLAILFAAWVLVAGGAPTVSELELPSLIRRRRRRSDGKPTPEWQIKLYAALAPIWIAAWLLMLVHMNAPIPK